MFVRDHQASARQRLSRRWSTIIVCHPTPGWLIEHGPLDAVGIEGTSSYGVGISFDYHRHGPTTLFAALNVLTGSVIGQCLPRHRHEEFLKFLRTNDREVSKDLAVHLILDNGAPAIGVGSGAGSHACHGVRSGSPSSPDATVAGDAVRRGQVHAVRRMKARISTSSPMEKP